MLKTIRKFRLINKLIRKMLLFVEKNTIRVSNRWRVSGAVKIHVDDTVVTMYSDCDDPIVDCFYYGRQYQEISDLSLFIRLAKVSKVVFDIGAFTGLYSLFSAKVNSQCVLYSFEPNPVNFRRLVKNTEMNQFKNVNCFPLAVGSHSTIVDFFCSTNQEITDTSSADFDFSKASYGGAMNWEGQKVQQVSIDDFLVREKINQVDLIKIDAEHYELSVFQGMINTVKAFRPIVLCEIFLDDERRLFFDSFVKTNNYFIYGVIHEGIIRLDEGITPNHDGLNFLFAPGRTSHVYTSFTEVDLMITELLKMN